MRTVAGRGGSVIPDFFLTVMGATDGQVPRDAHNITRGRPP